MSLPERWFVNDRVTREIYMDDGTWYEKGDKCLPGPLKHGKVIRVYRDKYDQYVHDVMWDNGKAQFGLFVHGLDRERSSRPASLRSAK